MSLQPKDAITAVVNGFEHCDTKYAPFGLGELSLGKKKFQVMESVIRRCYMDPKKADEFMTRLKSDPLLKCASRVCSILCDLSFARFPAVQL